MKLKTWHSDPGDLGKKLPGVRKNVSLAGLTTFKIGGRAQYFFEARRAEDIVNAAKTARQSKIPFFILGEGSNLLVSDSGFGGLVIKVNCRKYYIKKTLLYAEAGVPLSLLARIAGKRKLSGLEWASGLPGTLGGAIRGNAGAFGGEIKDNIRAVKALDKNGCLRVLSKKESQFSYRNSIFKKKKWIVLGAAIRLHGGDGKKIQAIAQAHIKFRKERHPLEYPNAGSFFKNCDLKKVPKRIYPLVKAVVKNDPFPVVPAAYLISEAGLKGKRVGAAQVSRKHPNFIVNLGGAKAKDVIRLKELIKKEINKKFGIALEEEVEYLRG